MIGDQAALTETLSVASPLDPPKTEAVDKSPKGLETPVLSEPKVATDYSADASNSVVKTSPFQSSTQNSGSTKIKSKDTDPLTGLSTKETTVGVSAIAQDSLLSNSDPQSVVIPTIPNRDQAVTAVGAEEASGGIKITWTVTNVGNQTLASSPGAPAWDDIIYISDDTVWDALDQPLYTLNVTTSLAPQASYTESTVIPTGLLEAARPYIIVTTNLPGRSGENAPNGLNNQGLVLGVGDANCPLNFIPGACGSPIKVPVTSEAEQHSGALIETHDLVTYESRGESRGLTLRYDSLQADPRQIVNFEYSRVYNQPNQLMIAKLNVNRGSFSTQAGGYQGNQFGLTGGENFWKIPTISGFGQVNAALQVNMRGAASGVYNYTLQRGIQTYDPSAPQFSPLLTQTQGSLTSINRIGSRLGNGWTIEELQEVVVNPDNSVLLIEGDGTSLIYKPNGSGGYTSQTSDYSTLVKLSNGTFQRTLKNGTVYGFNSSNQLASVRESNGDLTQ
jgi:hypothetical protein